MTKARNFKRLDQATSTDLRLIVRETDRCPPDPATQVLYLFQKLEHSPARGHPVNSFQHALQSATLAMEAGEDEEMIAVALLHDIGDEIAPNNHGQFAAQLLGPYISEANRWLLEHHAPFQGYYFWHVFGEDRHARNQYLDCKHAEHTQHFVEQYDMPAFDAEFATPNFTTFIPIVKALFSRSPKRRDLVVS